MIVKIVMLGGCGKCANLKQMFSNAGINYHFSTCDDDPENCDNLEALTDEIAYPMVLLTKSNGAIFEVLHTTNSYERLSEGPRNKGDILCIPYRSIEEIFMHVKNKLNL